MSAFTYNKTLTLCQPNRNMKIYGVLQKLLLIPIQPGIRQTKNHYRGGSRIFFRRGCTRLLLYFNTNKPHSFFFFCRIPVVLENRKSSQGGCAPPAPSPQIRPCLLKQVKPSPERKMIKLLTSDNSFPQLRHQRALDSTKYCSPVNQRHFDGKMRQPSSFYHEFQRECRSGGNKLYLM